MSSLEGPTAHAGVTLIVGAAQFALTWTDLRQMRTTGVARDSGLDALDRRYLENQGEAMVALMRGFIR